jgi:lipopolysaccharide export LptBFGC system permease protein LptF
MVVAFDDIFDMSQKGATSGGLDNAVRILRNVADFYTYKSILIFVQLAPVIPVVAAAFTLLRMMRFNELVATLAAGVPLLRVAAPIIIASLVLSVIVLPLTQEVIIPSVIYKVVREHDEVGNAEARAFPVRALEDDKGAILVAANFYPATATAPPILQEVDLIERNADKQPIVHVAAEKAVWKDGKWVLTKGQTMTGLLVNDLRPTSVETAVLPSTVTPEDIILYRSRDYVDLLSTSRINELLVTPRSYGVADLLRVKNFRYAQYLNNIILLLLCLPCVMTREPRSLKTGGVFLLGVVGVYLAVIFVAQYLAGTTAPVAAWAANWPALMAAVPILLFGPIAVYALDRIKT